MKDKKMKKGRISNLDRAFVEQNRKLGPEKLAKELGRSVDTINQILETIDKKPKGENPFKTMIREKGKAKNARAMTPEVSQYCDAVRKKTVSDPSYIHRPLGDNK